MYQTRTDVESLTGYITVTSITIASPLSPVTITKTVGGYNSTCSAFPSGPVTPPSTITITAPGSYTTKTVVGSTTCPTAGVSTITSTTTCFETKTQTTCASLPSGPVSPPETTTVTTTLAGGVSTIYATSYKTSTEVVSGPGSTTTVTASAECSTTGGWGPSSQTGPVSGGPGGCPTQAPNGGGWGKSTSAW